MAQPKKATRILHSDGVFVDHLTMPYTTKGGDIMIHDLIPSREVIYYISFFDLLSPLMDCEDAIEIDSLNRLNEFTPKQISKGERIIVKYLPLLSNWHCPSLR